MANIIFRSPVLNDVRKIDNYYEIVWDTIGHAGENLNILLYVNIGGIPGLVETIATDIVNSGLCKHPIPFGMDELTTYFFKIEVPGDVAEYDSAYFTIAAQQVMDDFYDIIDFDKVVIIEIETGVEIYSATWTQVGLTDVYYISYEGKEAVRVESDGVELARVFSLAGCTADPDSYFHDLNNMIFYVHVSGGGGGTAVTIPNASIEAWSGPVETNLEYFYTMDNISGASIVDEQANQNATMVGGSYASGYINDAAILDGGNDRIDCNWDTDGWSTLTICFWIKITAGIDSGDVIFGSRNASSQLGPFLQYQTGRLLFSAYINDVYKWQYFNQEINDSAYHFVVMRYDGVNLSLNVDMGTWADRPATGNMSNIGVDLNFGCFNKNGVYSNFCDCDLDQIRVYTSALTDLQLNTLFSELQIAETPDDFAASADQTGTSQLIKNVAVVHDSTYSAEMAIDASESEVILETDALTLLISTQYKFGFYYRNSAAAKTMKVQIRDSGSSIYLQDDLTWGAGINWIDVANSNGAWTQKNTQFVSHASFTDYVFVFSNDTAFSSSIYIDLLSLQTVEGVTTFLQSYTYIGFTNQHYKDKIIAFAPELSIKDIYYEPLLNTSSIPNLGQKVGWLYNSAMTIQFGKVKFLNDGWWWEFQNTYNLHNKNIKVKIGEKDSEYDDYVTIYAGITKKPQISDRRAVIDLKDVRVGDFRKIPTERLTVDTWANLHPSWVNKPSPILFGTKTNIKPANVDTVNFKYLVSQTVFNTNDYYMEGISAVYKDAAVLTITTDYTIDLATGLIDLVADPGDGLITCDAEGIQCGYNFASGAQTDAFTEQASDILFFILTELNLIPQSRINLSSFASLQGIRTQKCGHYLDKATDTLDLVRLLQSSGIFYLIPTLDNRYFIRYYDRITPSGTNEYDNYDYKGFDMLQGTEQAYKQVILKYDVDPIDDKIYKEVLETDEDVAYSYGIQESLTIETLLTDSTEAATFATFYFGLVSVPANIVKANLPPTVLSNIPGDKLYLSRSIIDGNGNEIEILDRSIYAILETRKNISNARVDVTAILDSQAGGTAAHADVPHTDDHGDEVYVDHTDEHADSAHLDTYTDEAHANSYSDVHDDVIYGDGHVDLAHQDYNDSYSDLHTDFYVDHTDSYVDGVPTLHADMHGDEYADEYAVHQDSQHGDDHTDAAHEDSYLDDYTDTEHTDLHSDGHGDTYTDHSDGPYLDTYSDISHVDSEI